MGARLRAYGPQPAGMDAPDRAGPSEAMCHALAPLVASAFSSAGILFDEGSPVVIFFPRVRQALSTWHQLAF